MRTRRPVGCRFHLCFVPGNLLRLAFASSTVTSMPFTTFTTSNFGRLVGELVTCESLYAQDRILARWGVTASEVNAELNRRCDPKTAYFFTVQDD